MHRCRQSSVSLNSVPSAGPCFAARRLCWCCGARGRTLGFRRVSADAVRIRPAPTRLLVRPAHVLAGTIPEDLIRLSVGVENVHDLVTDIQQAFELATHPHVHDVRLISREGSSAVQSGLIGSPMASPAAGPLPTAAEVEGMRRQLALLSERVEVAEARRAESKQVALETRVFASRVASLSMGAIFIAGALAAGALIAASRRE